MRGYRGARHIARVAITTMLIQMGSDMPTSKKTAVNPGWKHWLFQVVPPLLMLCLFLATSSGTSLVFMAGFLILPVLISLISIIAKLIFFKKRKYHLVRPALTVAVFILIFVIAHWTYAMALEHTVREAREIHRQCNRNQVCPASPAGWQGKDSWVRRNDLGFWLKYTASYYRDGNRFSIRLYQGPDLGDVINGGVDFPFAVARYEE